MSLTSTSAPTAGRLDSATTVPADSDTVLVSSHPYNAAGWVQDTVDPGHRHATLYDALGRTTETIANYTGSAETSNSDVPPSTRTTATTMC